MKDDAKATERLELKRSFATYERAVWTVNSVEGHLLHWYRDLVVCFDRYPRLERANGDPVTPDFVVVFKGNYVIIGEAKRAMGLTDRMLEDRFDQLMGYDNPLTVRTNYSNGVLKSADHDIWVLLNPEYARKETLRLKPFVEAARKNGKLKRSLVIFQVHYDSQQADPHWVCTWVTDSDRFRDERLPRGRRLSERHQIQGEAIAIYPKLFAQVQAKHYFCNDDPPPIYIAVILWSRVFRNMMPEAERLDWVENDCSGEVEFVVTLDAIQTQGNTSLGTPLKKEALRKALDLLAKGQLAHDEGDGKYRIRYKQFAPRLDEGASDEDASELRADGVKQGIINAVTHATKKVAAPPKRTVKPRRSRRASHPDQMTLL